MKNKIPIIVAGIIVVIIVIIIITLLILTNTDIFTKNKTLTPSSQPSTSSQPNVYSQQITDILNSYLGRYKNVNDTEFPVKLNNTDLKKCLNEAFSQNHKLVATKSDSNGNITGCYVHSDKNDNTFNKYGESNVSDMNGFSVYRTVPQDQIINLNGKMA